ncbi:hypothetical protein SDC9_206817 [bioreactor metagenome]|uniref:Uncharacterized protein n=1 Tax=bioreactor metagenome TaxID=1076179 RepID=A0A645J8R8_9ZZZZ
MASGATTPAARRPSSSHTPRQMQTPPPRMRSRTEISVPGSWTRRTSSASARSGGRARARMAADEHSGASGPSPSAREAPVRCRRSFSGSQSHRATSAAPSASKVAVASQLQRSFGIVSRHSGQRAAERIGPRQPSAKQTLLRPGPRAPAGETQGRTTHDRARRR